MDTTEETEALRSELIDLAEKGFINQTKSYLRNKRRVTHSVLKNIMNEYIKHKEDLNRQKMAVKFVLLSVSLSDNFCGAYFTIRDKGKFIEKILEDENIMFVIKDLLPSFTPDDYYSKYLFAMVGLGILCRNHINITEHKQSEEEDLTGSSEKVPSEDLQSKN